MLFVPQGPDFQWYYSTTLNTRPAGNFGVGFATNSAVFPNYSSWTQIATSTNIAQDVYGIMININSGPTTSGVNIRTFINLGVDNTGGTNYTIIIPDLMVSKAIAYNSSPGGIWYYFPLYIKSGSSVAIQSRCNTTNLGYANITFYGQPRRPDALRVGSYVTPIGLNSYSGTTVVPTVGSEGSWYSLGSTTRSHWWWQMGVDYPTGAMDSVLNHFDLSAGDATNKKLLFENQIWTSFTNETIGNMPQTVNSYNNVASGSEIFCRGLATFSAVTSPVVVAYGLGG